MDTAISPSAAGFTEPPLRLGDLVARLGSDAVLRTSLTDPTLLVSGAEFLDVSAEPVDLTGVVGIVVSAEQLSTAALREVVTAAAAGGCPVIALRVPPERLGTIVALADDAGIALLDVQPHVSWRRLDAFVSSLVAEHNRGIGDPASAAEEPLYALADSVAQVFGGSVAIEDLGRNVLAYSSVPEQLIDPLRTRGILTRQVPTNPFNDEQYQAVLRSAGPASFPGRADELPRSAIAVRAGSVPLGTIWAIDAEPSTSGPARARREQILEEAARAAAGHMMRNWQVWGANRRPREAVLRRLLDGTSLTGVEWIELGIADGAPVTLVGVTAPAGRLSAATLDQVQTTSRRHFESFRADAVTAVVAGVVWVLLPGDAVDEARRLSEQLIPQLDRVVDRRLVAAVAAPAAHGGTLVDRRQEVVAVLRSGTHAQARVLTRADVSAQLVIDAVAPLLADDPLLADPALQKLLSTPAGVTVAETLLAWCASHGNVAAAAKSLGIHENTVRYRLARAQDAHGIRLNSPDDLLVTWLRLRQALGAALGGGTGSSPGEGVVEGMTGIEPA
ncbi:PucR family transcriptional regulator [Microbacterium sp.]|uniref:PucR family transcriptional regulator n=1 Tax=Microbacterium sp. TaxID=51671 RepID=UPI003A946033